MSRTTVWKYPLTLADRQVITVPAGPHPLHVDLQRGEPHLWLLVDPLEEREEMVIRILGTGWTPVDTLMWRHLGTINVTSRGLVWHYFWDRGEA